MYLPQSINYEAGLPLKLPQSYFTVTYETAVILLLFRNERNAVQRYVCSTVIRHNTDSACLFICM